MQENLKAKAILKSVFGYDQFRLNQEKIIDSVLSGKDTLAIMPTGGGKSLCYQLPALYLGGLTVVVSPLISLMQDQVTGLHELGIEARYLNSSLDFDERQNILSEVKNGRVRLLYLAPEGILSEWMLNFLRQLPVQCFAIDEAHCVSQWGHEFRTDYTRLNILKKTFNKIPFIALTATADEKTRKDIILQLGLDDPNIFISSFDRPNIRYMILEKDKELTQLIEFINDGHRNETGVVYCLSRNKVEKVAEELVNRGLNAVPYHAGLSQKVREKNQKRFDSEDDIIVVATIAFGMGIDKPDVRFVAHLDLPKSIEGYYQETGRAGRDGKPAIAWMVYGLSDVVKLSQMLESTQASELYKKEARRKLDQMLALCEISTCRRQFLLNYFAENLDEKCGNCDTCLNPPEQVDATVNVQKLLSAIFKTGQIFGAGHVIDVLRGSKSEKVLTRKHDQLSVYGIGKDLAKREWNSIIRQLLTMNFISIKDWEYKSLILLESSRAILRGDKKINLRKTSVVHKSKKESYKRSKPVMTEHGLPELFEELRALRKVISQEKRLPPYMIFSDKTLHDMCALLPKDRDQMLMVNGVGESKLEKYSEQFIEVIQQY